MLRKTFIGILLLAILFVVAAIYLAEAILHVPKKSVTQHNIARAESIADKYQYELLNAELLSNDAVLKGWYFHKAANHRVVLLLHGQGDARTGMLHHAEIFLRNNFDVLVPDSRAHGLSGGAMSTSGIKEVADMSKWIDWLEKRDAEVRIFGLGESMGAAILLQTAKNESRWQALVAESAFSDFRSVAIERIHAQIGLPSSLLVNTAIKYAWLRHGLNFQSVSPADAVSKTSVPILLIHGTVDRNISPKHSDQIAARNSLIKIWHPPNTGHTAAFGTFPKEFETKILRFFEYATK